MATRATTDKRLLESGGIVVVMGGGSSVDAPLTGGINPLTGVQLGAALANTIVFQFPPKITGDGRKHSWQESDIMSHEPLALPGSGSGRDLTLSFSYIYDNIDGWNAERIKRQLTLIRGYFVKFASAGDRKEAMTIKLRIFGIGGQSLGTFRSKGCDMKYSETMIYEEGREKEAFPFRTDVTIDLASYFKSLSARGELELEGFDEDELGATEARINEDIPSEWY